MSNAAPAKSKLNPLHKVDSLAVFVGSNNKVTKCKYQSNIQIPSRHGLHFGQLTLKSL